MRGRFNTSKGEGLALRNYTKLPKALYLAIKRKYLKIYPSLPWIPFSASQRLNEVIRPDWNILEIGAGMSTIWLAQRCNTLVSFEADLDWFNNLKNQIGQKAINNIDLRYEWKAEKMSNFDEFPDNYFNLIYIDGGPRELCCVNAISKIKQGGYIYLDNSDNTELSGNGKLLLEQAVNNDSHLIETHIDFVPGNFMINEGTLVKIV